MNAEHEEAFDESQPALLVTYGNTPRKWRPLDRDVLVLGRAHGCDLGFNSPEVSQVHCILTRGPQGWAVRDCGSRVGTRLNGKAIAESPLHDGDVIQVGPFTFQAHLPAVPAYLVRAHEQAEARCDRLRKSREKLARLALRLRQRLREAGLFRRGPLANQDLLKREAELNRQAETLRERLHDGDARAGRLEHLERELAAERERLRAETAELQAKVEKAERELERRRGEVEAEIRERWQQVEERCRQAERCVVEQLEQAVRNETGALEEEKRKLQLRKVELDHYAGYLRRGQQRLAKLQRQHVEAWQQTAAQLKQLRKENALYRRLLAKSVEETGEDLQLTPPELRQDQPEPLTTWHGELQGDDKPAGAEAAAV